LLTFLNGATNYHEKKSNDGSTTQNGTQIGEVVVVVVVVVEVVVVEVEVKVAVGVGVAVLVEVWVGVDVVFEVVVI